MTTFALKAAVLDYTQLVDRAKVLYHASMPVALELHTFGERDLGSKESRNLCLANLTRLSDTFGKLDLTVHVPLQEISVVTKLVFDTEQVIQAIEFARECGAKKVVMHRYWGLVYGDARQRVTKEEATEGFNDMILSLAQQAPDIQIFVENVGYYSLLPRTRTSFLAGPLDHFFPWEIQDFRSFLKKKNLTNVQAFVDVAHATLSANLFNWRRAYPLETEGDPRYSGILTADLERSNFLHPFDFVDVSMPWLHVSDSIFFREPHATSAELPLEGLTSEGLELGTGNLPFHLLHSSVGLDTCIVLEVEPGPGESHHYNGAQHRSLDFLRSLWPHEKRHFLHR